MAVHLVGAPGAAPRLQMMDAAEAEAQKMAGEVCVSVDDIGAWLIAADGRTAAPVVPDEATQWMDIRRIRDALLTACDWTQLPDVPEATRAAWVSYRQSLRDITDTYSHPADVVWPTAPAQS